jgi:hypothetical protein
MFGTSRRSWEKNNIKMDLIKTDREILDNIDPAQVRELWRALVITITNFGFPPNFRFILNI